MAAVNKPHLTAFGAADGLPHSVRTSSRATSKPASDIVMTACWVSAEQRDGQDKADMLEAYAAEKSGERPDIRDLSFEHGQLAISASSVW